MSLEKCPKCSEIASKCICYLWAARRMTSKVRIRTTATNEEKAKYLLSNGWFKTEKDLFNHKWYDSEMKWHDLEVNLETAFAAQYRWNGYDFEDWIEARIEDAADKTRRG